MDLRKRTLNLSEPERTAAWFTSFEAKVRGKQLTDDETTGTLQITDLFLELCGEDAVLKLARVAKPRPLEKMPFKTLKQLTMELVEPKKLLTIAERTNFLAIRKNFDESTDDLHLRINHAADRCAFELFKTGEEDPVEELKKMAYINAFTDANIKKELLDYLRLTPKATYDDLKERIRQYNQTNAFINRGRAEIKTEVGDINIAIQSKPVDCGNCGTTHPRRQCPAYNKSCRSCSRKGHFSHMCRNGRRPQINDRNQSNSTRTPPPRTGNSNRQNYTSHFVEDVPLSPDSSNQNQSDDDNYFICNAQEDNKINNIGEIIENITINSQSIPMQHDNGASCTILSTLIWQQLGSPDLQPSDTKLRSYDDNGLSVIGKCYVDIKRDNNVIYNKFPVQIVNSSRPYGLLGRDILNNNDIQCLGSVSSAEFLPVVKGVVATMKLKPDASPKFCQARPVPLPLQAAATAELDRLQTMGVIEPIETGGAANSSPVVWVKKPSGGLRMCVDFSVHANSKILSDAYPIPNVESIFSELKGAKHFAKIDLKSAYWQIAIDEAAQDLSIINTHKGLFRVTRLQMGMKNSSAIFQQVIEQVLQGLKGVVSFQDDVLIFAHTLESLLKRVNAVMERFKQRRLSVNKEKCLQHVSEITFLGFQISSKGIGPDPRLVEKVLAIDTPKNKQEVSSFVGLVNFFGRMVPNFAEKIAPLNSLRKQNIPFEWNSAAQQAFDQLKAELASAPVVQPYSLSKPVTLTTDASGTAIAGILTQNGHPVIFVSKTLTLAERKYSATEREAYAVVWCVERLRQFLLGRKFTIVTDHQSLAFLFGENKGIPKTASARVSRWAIKLMAFDFHLKHQPGATITHADALSRLSQTTISREDVVASVTIATDSAFFSSIISQDYLLNATNNDRLAASIKNRIVSGTWSNLSEAEKPFARVKDQLTIENEIIYYKSTPFIPSATNLCSKKGSSHSLRHPCYSTTALTRGMVAWYF